MPHVQSVHTMPDFARNVWVLVIKSRLDRVQYVTNVVVEADGDKLVLLFSK